MRKLLLLITLALLFTSQISYASFNDMTDHWAKDTVDYLHDKSIIDGVNETTYNPEGTLNKDAFIKLLMVTLYPEDDFSYDTYWAEGYINKAIALGYIESEHIYNVPITRLEVVETIHRALGENQDLQTLPFSDVASLNTNEMKSIQTSVALNIISGYPDATFRPNAYLTRAQAATITYNLKMVLQGKSATYNLYYGINAYDQYKTLTTYPLSQVESVTFAWGYIDDLGQVDLDQDNPYKHKRPSGYEEPLNFFKSRGIKTYLNIFTETNIAEKLANESLLASLLSLSEEYDGITLDLEMIAADDWDIYLTFIETLRGLLPETTALNITLQPRDISHISSLTDHVDTIILMLHDYDTKSLSASGAYEGLIETPLAPLKSVRADLVDALALLNESTTDKVMVQLSLSATQWQSSNSTLFDPNMDGTSYGAHPTYDMIENRIEEELDQGLSLNDFSFYSKEFESPYLFFEEGLYTNSLWYETLRSLQMKMFAASDLSVDRFSIWRIGNIPEGAITYDLNIYEYLLK